jgi:hypothetical protein
MCKLPQQHNNDTATAHLEAGGVAAKVESANVSDMPASLTDDVPEQTKFPRNEKHIPHYMLCKSLLPVNV